MRSSELFEKIQRLANSKLENHQHVQALLTVVTSIIQQKGAPTSKLCRYTHWAALGGPLNATSYFGILLQLLAEVHPSPSYSQYLKRTDHSADELTAIVTLLAITLPMYVCDLFSSQFAQASHSCCAHEIPCYYKAFIGCT